MEEEQVTIGRCEVNNFRLLLVNYFDLIFTFFITIVVLLLICKSILWLLIILSLIVSFVIIVFFSVKTKYILYKCDFDKSSLKVCFYYYTFSGRRTVECSFDEVDYLKIKLSIFDTKVQVLRIYCKGKRLFFARRSMYPWTEEEFEKLLDVLELYCIDKKFDDSF